MTKTFVLLVLSALMASAFAASTKGSTPEPEQHTLNSNSEAAPVPLPAPIHPGDNMTLIMDKGIYTVTNLLDGGVLTIDERNQSVPVYDRTYAGLAGQKWRLDKALIGRSFLMVPTLNEKAVLDLDWDTLGIWGRIAAFGNQRYWNLVWMGEGVIQIKNYQKPSICLTSFGLDKPVNTKDCENSPAQQWVFKLL